MKTIPLTQGKVALVDDSDYEFLVNYGSWCADLTVSSGIYYATCRRDYFNIKMHRLLLPNAKMVDHKDGNGLNNQRNNLRSCTRSQNLANSKLRSDGASGYKGVTRNQGK